MVIESEKQLIALCQLKPEVISLLKIKPEHLENEELQKILTMMVNSYLKYKYIKIDSYEGSFNADLYFEISVNELIVPSMWKEILEATQKDILEDYKKRKIKLLSFELEKGRITYQELSEKIENLNNFKIEEEINYLSETEIRENLFLQTKKIIFDSFQKLSRRLSLVENDLLIVGATTGFGKSSFLLNLLISLSNNYQCIYFNLEMSKTIMYRRILGITSQQKIDDIDNPNEFQTKIFSNSIKILHEKKIIFEHDKYQIDDIVSTVARSKDINRHTIVFIDHIGLIKVKNFHNSYERMTEVMKELRKITLKYNCTIICASQLNREAMSTKELHIGMLKDSGEVENSARKIILLYGNEEEDNNSLRPLINCEIAKNDSGSRGIIEMVYDKQSQVFIEK